MKVRANLIDPGIRGAELDQRVDGVGRLHIAVAGFSAIHIGGSQASTGQTWEQTRGGRQACSP